jgi:small subunit ribosomal protein S17
MADEPDNETPEAEAPATDAPQADAAAGDAPEAEAPATDAPQAEAAVGDAPEESPPADAPPAPAAGAAATSEPEPLISPKERRRKARSQHAGEPRPTRSPQERHAERLLERRDKAARRRARRLQERAKAAERSKLGAGSAAAAGELAPVHAPVEGTRKVRQGVVVSDKAAKTITVRIDVARRHRRYEKIVRSSSTLHAHDENNDAREGDIVRVIESRPLSRTKRWKLADVLERAQ